MKVKNLFKKNMVPICIYLIMLIGFSLLYLQNENFLNPNFEIAMILLLLIMGIFSIVHFSKNKKNLHRTLFVIIILFGIVSVFLSPINDISDEMEHTTRAEITSQGYLTPNYVLIPNTNVSGYQTINSINLLSQSAGENVFNTNVDDGKINYTPDYFSSAFSQNPFYAYVLPAIGMFLAKLLDLNAIWLLWLGRLFNVILYGVVVSFAVKKSPIFKFPLSIVAILPLAIYQAASMSADCFFNSFAILSLAYFFVLYKSKTVRYKDLGIFYISILLCGLLKAPYLALSLLIFLVPTTSFKNTTQNVISKVGILALLLIGLGWSNYSTPQILNSWRGEYFAMKNVNSTGQMNYLLSHPLNSIGNVLKTFISLPVIVDRLFYFSNDVRQYTSTIMASLYSIFFILFSLFYPLKEKFSKINRIKALVIGMLIYVGVFFVQYLTWIPVGSPKVIDGVFGRYFIPLMVFLPLILNLNIENKISRDKLSLIVMAIALGFISGMFMLTVAIKY